MAEGFKKQYINASKK